VAGPQPPLPERRNAVTAESLRTGNDGDSTNHNRRPNYWCHSCQMQVIVRIIEETKEVECIACSNSFVEEMEETELSANENASRTATRTRARESPNRPQQQQELPSVIHQLIRSMNSNTQDPVAVYLHGNSGPGMFTFNFGNEIASNLGDYHFGSGAALDALLNQLMQADQNNRGTPPTPKEVINSLPKKQITAECVDMECAICKENFRTGESATELKCRHSYHKECIEPWLNENSTCPVCRASLLESEST